MKERPSTPCRLCGKPTEMLGTKLCEPCWHVERAVLGDPDLARRILADLDKPAAA